MGKPRLIILIRHAQSEGNKNRDIHQTIPDHRVKLTPEGWQQAYEAGRRLKAMLRPDDTLHFFTSPYRRTRETTEGILSTLTEDDSPFERPDIKVYEEPRLREQDFGNFQPCSAEMERMWQERADYGHFFYRIPNGESAADAYDRISGFNESLWRQFGEDDFASVCVLVTHGLLCRVFLMKWYHFTVEYFEDLRNINHCEFLIMNQEENGKYTLENKLRTWSELRRERELLMQETKDKEGKEASSEIGRDANKDATRLPRNKSTVVVRKWGGCPNGCDHSRHFNRLDRRDDLEMLRQRDEAGAKKHSTELANASRANAKKSQGRGVHVTTPVVTNGNNIADVTAAAGSLSLNPVSYTMSSSAAITASPAGVNSPTAVSPLLARRTVRRAYNSDDDDPNDPNLHDALENGASVENINIRRAQEEIVSSPDATPSFISPEDRIRSLIGSDFDSTQSIGSLSAVGYQRHSTAAPASKSMAAAGNNSGDAAKPSQQQPNGLLMNITEKGTRATAEASEMSRNGSQNGSHNEDADDEDEGDPSLVSQELADESGMGRGMRANRLGDGSSGSEVEENNGEDAEKRDRSIHGSIY
ncbi:Phosphoglycerate mutase-like protein AT74 [Ceratocystis fimbriata CBS 114723]|uniref:Phosphoglycerate mutase-like protein AT74 n=1 Tax=Ceratocystis fimbriata CBS 114723 TaxID=1035309 RepID=A0A2C5X1R1_9PEZI|nr:Phosphoglycerate mutase-like protein AT74 [Ceratocystis fimbriata CBS 114723]